MKDKHVLIYKSANAIRRSKSKPLYNRKKEKENDIGKPRVPLP